MLYGRVAGLLFKILKLNVTLQTMFLQLKKFGLG